MTEAWLVIHSEWIRNEGDDAGTYVVGIFSSRDLALQGIFSRFTEMRAHPEFACEVSRTTSGEDFIRHDYIGLPWTYSPLDGFVQATRLEIDHTTPLDEVGAE